jgi:radical SAM superfamily enzyme YgiQ (UPF0313 family)
VQKDYEPLTPVFGQITPFPSTPLYKRLQEDGRLVRPKHWLKFEKNTMAHVPLKMTIDQTHRELLYAWTHSYNAARNAEAVQAMSDTPVGSRIFHFITRLAFRAIYFPQTTRRAWIKVLLENWRTVFSLGTAAFGSLLTPKRRMEGKDGSSSVITPLRANTTR